MPACRPLARRSGSRPASGQATASARSTIRCSPRSSSGDRIAPRRCGACARRCSATEVVGLSTNLEFLARVVDHDAFASGAVATAFVADHAAELLAPAPPPDDEALAIAALWLLCRRRREADGGGSRRRRSTLALASGRRLAAQRRRAPDAAPARRRRGGRDRRTGRECGLATADQRARADRRGGAGR